MIIKRRVLALGAATFFAATAATAQTEAQPWEGLLETIAAAGFEQGTNSGVSPVTESEEFRCAVQWDVWNIAYAANALKPEMERTLPSALSRGSTTTTRDEWRQAIAHNMDTTPMLAMIEIIKPTRSRTQSQDQLLAGLRGDKIALFRTASSLGTCAHPPRPGVDSLKAD